MQVIIDGDRNFSFVGEPTDLLSAIAVASDHLRAKGRAILSVRVDGNPVPHDALAARLEGRPVSSIGELTISSERIDVLVHNSLTELEGVLPDLPNACRRLAEIFQSETPGAGFDPFQQLAGIWKTIKEREQLVVSALDLDTAGLAVKGMAWTAMHDDLNRYLNEAADALRQNDCVLLGDLLEYELAPRAEREADIVVLLRDLARERPGPN